MSQPINDLEVSEITVDMNSFFIDPSEIERPSSAPPELERSAMMKLESLDLGDEISELEDIRNDDLYEEFYNSLSPHQRINLPPPINFDEKIIASSRSRSNSMIKPQPQQQQSNQQSNQQQQQQQQQQPQKSEEEKISILDERFQLRDPSFRLISSAAPKPARRARSLPRRPSHRRNLSKVSISSSSTSNTSANKKKRNSTTTITTTTSKQHSRTSSNSTTSTNSTTSNNSPSMTSTNVNTSSNSSNISVTPFPASGTSAPSRRSNHARTPSLGTALASLPPIDAFAYYTNHHQPQPNTPTSSSSSPMQLATSTSTSTSIHSIHSPSSTSLTDSPGLFGRRPNLKPPLPPSGSILPINSIPSINNPTGDSLSRMFKDSPHMPRKSKSVNSSLINAATSEPTVDSPLLGGRRIASVIRNSLPTEDAPSLSEFQQQLGDVGSSSSFPSHLSSSTTSASSPTSTGAGIWSSSSSSTTTNENVNTKDNNSSTTTTDQQSSSSSSTNTTPNSSLPEIGTFYSMYTSTIASGAGPSRDASGIAADPLSLNQFQQLLQVQQLAASSNNIPGSQASIGLLLQNLDLGGMSVEAATFAVHFIRAHRQTSSTSNLHQHQHQHHHHQHQHHHHQHQQSRHVRRQSASDGIMGLSANINGANNNGNNELQVCRFYQSGFCNRGDRCPYLHASSASTTTAPSSTSSHRRNPSSSSNSGTAGGGSNPSPYSGTYATNLPPTSAPSHHRGHKRGASMITKLSSTFGGLDLEDHVVDPMTGQPSSNNSVTLSNAGSSGGGGGSTNASNPSNPSNNTNTAARGHRRQSSTASHHSHHSHHSRGSGSKNLSLPLTPTSLDATTTLEQVISKIYLMCKDQFGCRFLQKQIEERGGEAIDLIFPEVYEHIVELSTEPFGNYLCQKLIENCSDSQRLMILDKVAPELVAISLNMHGTRAVQKMIDVLSSPEQVRIVSRALSNSVVPLIKDLNSNHVIQRCLHRLSSTDNQFIYDAVAGHCVDVASHRHGCCVLQRCIDYATDSQKTQLIKEIAANALTLVQDPFGNYVVSYVLDLPVSPNLPKDIWSRDIVARLQGNAVSLSTQKFSSNVIEKCLQVSGHHQKKALIQEIIESDIARLISDPYANYVTQTCLSVAAKPEYQEQYEKLVAAIKPIIPMIRNTPYGKRIMSKIAKDAGYIGGNNNNNSNNNNGGGRGSNPSNSNNNSNHHHHSYHNNNLNGRGQRGRGRGGYHSNGYNNHNNNNNNNNNNNIQHNTNHNSNQQHRHRGQVGHLQPQQPQQPPQQNFNAVPIQQYSQGLPTMNMNPAMMGLAGYTQPITGLPTPFQQVQPLGSSYLTYTPQPQTFTPNNQGFIAGYGQATQQPNQAGQSGQATRLMAPQPQPQQQQQQQEAQQQHQ